MAQVDCQNGGIPKHGIGGIKFTPSTDTRTDKQNAYAAAKSLLEYFGSKDFKDNGDIEKEKRSNIYYRKCDPTAPRYTQRMAFEGGFLNNRFNELDNSESGVDRNGNNEKGNGLLTAKTWNDLMSRYGITGHRLKENQTMSVDEVKAFVSRLINKYHLW